MRHGTPLASQDVPGERGRLLSCIWNLGYFSERCTEKLPLRVDFIHRVEFGEVRSEERRGGKGDNLSSVLSHVCESDCMDCSMPGFSVHHQLLELHQIHVHRVGDAIQPSHPLLSPSPPSFNLSQHEGLHRSQFFTSGGQSIGVSASASVLPMNIRD